MNLQVCIPSLGRPLVDSLRIWPESLVYVDPSEVERYQEKHPGVVALPPGVQGNISRVRNWILEHWLSQGVGVCMMDDDLRAMSRWQESEKAEATPSQFGEFLETYTLLAQEFGVYLWGVNCLPDKMAYREHTPFSLGSVVLGPFSVHLPGSEIRYDESLPLKEDYDLFIQHMNHYRRVLRVNFWHYVNKQHAQVGGIASMRSMREEKRQFDLLQKKWGSRIVQVDTNRKGNANKKNVGTLSHDLNPIIKIPIPGV
jgi:hypothetical protein